MSQLNVKRDSIYTHEGATAQHISPYAQLRRSVMACLLWEDTFYEDGQSIADRISNLCAQVTPEQIADLAMNARSQFNLRHVPLLLCANLAKHGKGSLVGRTITECIQRPDELSEFLAIYWRHGKCPLSAQVKQGLAGAFRKFNEYQLAKYDRNGAIKLRDVLFLCHAKPKNMEQEALWCRLINGTMATPDTWEVGLSAGKDKAKVFKKLMAENTLGGLAFLRNLRNMKQAGINPDLVIEYSHSVNLSRVLPFRFISAARSVPEWEHIIEPMMLRALEGQSKLGGKTAIVVDNSGSMYYSKMSSRSDLTRVDAACALAVLLRELCKSCVVIGFGNEAGVIPARRGFALVDAIKNGPGGGTYTQRALTLAAAEGYDRIIVVTDEQSHQEISEPSGNSIGYFINVAAYENGIGYGRWTHIDGWSEAVLNYIQESEKNILM